MRRVIVVGAGGHGHVVLDILQAMTARANEPPAVIGFVDDDERLTGTSVLGIPVLGLTAQLRSVNHDAIIVAIGDNARRRTVTEECARGGEALTTAVHPTAIMSSHASLGPGAMVCAGAIVNPEANIGAGVILNTGCSVDHHCAIADYVHIGPGARLGGAVHVEAGAFVGIGAVVLPGLRVGAGATVGAGAVVTRDVPAGATVVGIPARLL